MRRPLAGLAAGALLLAGAAVVAPSAASGGGPVTLVVDTTVDDGALDDCTGAAGDCSLRGAFVRTQDDFSGDPATPVTIQVPAGDFVLADDLFLYNADVTVNGAGVGQTIVSADHSEVSHRHLTLQTDGPLAVTLTDMTFTGGLLEEDSCCDGASISADGGVDLTLQRMHFVDNENRQGHGGAVAVYEGGDTLVVEDSTFVGNSALLSGGAIHVDLGETAIITNSTFTGNHAALGGALYVGNFDQGSSGTAVLDHVTMAGNSASGPQGDALNAGGAIGVGSEGEVTVTSSIIEGSIEGEPVLRPAAVGDPIANCTLAEGGVLTSGGGNVVSDDTCNAIQATDQADTAANVGALGDNGGPTFTMALTASSPAVDAAGTTCSVPDDQRGVARPQDGNGDGTNGCDSGAYELAAVPDEPEDPADPPAALPVTAAPRFTG
ncbi:MAG: choice-of-anchor Q domain-containing protein [Acidimicrobiales bacterium]